MKIEEIIEQLVKHEISKHEAIDKIKDITNGLRRKESFEFVVGDVSTTTPSNHAILEIMIPYGYSKIEGIIKKGYKVDVSLVQ